jgi:hypothetical protein
MNNWRGEQMKLIQKIIGFSLWRQDKNNFIIVNDVTGKIIEKLSYDSFEIEQARQALMMYMYSRRA